MQFSIPSSFSVQTTAEIVKSCTKILLASDFKQIIRFNFFCMDLILDHLINSSVCIKSEGPVMAYPKIVETWRGTEGGGELAL